MLAMIKFVAYSPPGKTISSTIFCRNFSAFRLRVKAWMKALKALYSASWTRTENVFRLSATLPVMETAVAGGARLEAEEGGAKRSHWFRYWHGLLMHTPSSTGKWRCKLRSLPYVPTKFGELWSTNGENRTVGLSHRRNFVLPVSFRRGILSGEILSREDFIHFPSLALPAFPTLD